LFITKSRLLAEKVEREYIGLLHSLSTGPNAPLYAHERIRRWKSRRKRGIFNLDDAEDEREDLPQKFSKLSDSDFPLFLTMDTVSTILPINAIGTDDGCAYLCSCLVFSRVPPGPRAEICDLKKGTSW
jgi:hypothetical protein